MSKLGWMRLVLPLSLLVLSGSAHADEAEFAVAAKATTLRVGQKGPLEIVFAPKSPWHWNKDYPAKLTLVAEGLAVTQSELKQASDNENFKVSDSGVNAAFELSAGQAGVTNGMVSGKIGLCDDKVCIVKKVELAVVVTATP